MSLSQIEKTYDFENIIKAICNLNWESATEEELTDVAWAYYFFSIQFRENLGMACALFPADGQLKALTLGECNTDNLSPYPGICVPGERVDHDEFMRRALLLSPISTNARLRFCRLGEDYLEQVRGLDVHTRALSIGSYEDGGLEQVFKAILRGPSFSTPLLAAFKYFMDKHIEFDSAPGANHGVLSRGLTPDDRIIPLWLAFYNMLVTFSPTILTRKALSELQRETV